MHYGWLCICAVACAKIVLYPQSQQYFRNQEQSLIMGCVTGSAVSSFALATPRHSLPEYSRSLGIRLNSHGGTTFLWKDEVPRSLV